MKAALLLVLAASSCCAGAGRRVPTPNSQVVRYVFAETLPAETQVCVHRTPFDAGLSCTSLAELRQSIRGLRRASLEVTDAGLRQPLP